MSSPNSFGIIFILLAFNVLLLFAQGLSIPSCRRCERSYFVKATVNSEIVDDIPYDEDDDEAWIPDRDKKKNTKRNDAKGNFYTEEYINNDDEFRQPSTRQTYTPEEEDIIKSLGGRSMNRKASKREPGFLGDCTIKEIAHDFQVPIPYLADVLCTWGVPPPIDCDVPIGDMVTGEHCFAILEAIHTLDVGMLHDKYSDFDMISLCDEYGIDLKDAFQLAMKENWNLPFGVQTHLRVEQEEQLLQEFVSDDYN